MLSQKHKPFLLHLLLQGALLHCLDVHQVLVKLDCCFLLRLLDKVLVLAAVLGLLVWGVVILENLVHSVVRYLAFDGQVINMHQQSKNRAKFGSS